MACCHCHSATPLAPLQPLPCPALASHSAPLCTAQGDAEDRAKLRKKTAEEARARRREYQEENTAVETAKIMARAVRGGGCLGQRPASVAAGIEACIAAATGRAVQPPRSSVPHSHRLQGSSVDDIVKELKRIGGTPMERSAGAPPPRSNVGTAACAAAASFPWPPPSQHALLWPPPAPARSGGDC